MKEGWIGKQKGALHILYECGWINPNYIYFNIKKGNRKGIKIMMVVHSVSTNLWKSKKILYTKWHCYNFMCWSWGDFGL